MKAWKRKSLEEAREQIIAVEDAGHCVMQFTDYHWRIDFNIDVWPSSKKYMGKDHVVRNYQNIGDIFKQK